MKTFLALLWALLKKLLPLLPTLLTAGSAYGVWSAMGSAGYTAGNPVGLGVIELDPELTRNLAALFAGFVTFALAQLPYGDMLLKIWNQIAQPGLNDPERLTGAEERDQYNRIKGLAPRPTD